MKLSPLTSYDRAILAMVLSHTSEGNEAPILTASERTACGRLSARGLVTFRVEGPIVMARAS